VQGQSQVGDSGDQENNMDVELLDVSLVSISRLQGVKPLCVQTPSPKQDETWVFPDAQSSLRFEHPTTFQNCDANSIPDVSSVQSVSLCILYVTAAIFSHFQFHSSVHPDVMFPDLTKYITKNSKHPVTGGGFGDIWKCTYQTDMGPIKVCHLCYSCPLV